MRKFRDVVVDVSQNHTDAINCQRQNTLFLITDKSLFKKNQTENNSRGLEFSVAGVDSCSKACGKI